MRNLQTDYKKFHLTLDQWKKHQVGVILSFADCSQEGQIFYNVQLESLSNLPEVDAKPEDYKKFHLTLDQWKEIRQERGENIQKPKGKSADISLDNLKTGKRRSKPVTPVKPRRSKRGGENVDTSVHEDSEAEKTIINKKPLKQRKKPKELASSTDEDLMPISRRRTSRKKDNLEKLFENLTFLLTQGKPKPEEELSAMESETEDENDIHFQTDNMNRATLKKKIQNHGGKVLDKFPSDSPTV